MWYIMLAKTKKLCSREKTMKNRADEDLHSYKLLLVASIVLAIAVILIILGCYSQKNNPGNIRALLELNFGGIVFIGAAYSLVSEFFLKKDFAKQLRASIDQRLEKTSLNESIIKLGINCIRKDFALSELWQRIENANSVLIVAMRDSSLFRGYYDKILQKIKDGNTKFTIILLNPEGQIIPSIVKKFSGMKEDELRESIRNTINTFIKSCICDKLPEDKKQNLTLRLYDEVPVYSAYLFDNEELWYIPYHFRHDYRSIPVFILKDNEQGAIKESELYKDLYMLNSDTLSKKVSL